MSKKFKFSNEGTQNVKKEKKPPPKRTGKCRQIKKIYKGEDLTPLLVRDIPRSLRTKFKAWCKSRGYKMSERLRLFMIDCTRGKHD